MTRGQTLKPIVGHDERPTDRVRTALATYEPGTVEQLRWHPIEAYYFVISGRAIVRDLEGNEYRSRARHLDLCAAGHRGGARMGNHGATRLLSVRASTDATRKLQFTVDKKPRRSYIDLDELARRGGC